MNVCCVRAYTDFDQSDVDKNALYRRNRQLTRWQQKEYCDCHTVTASAICGRQKSGRISIRDRRSGAGAHRVCMGAAGLLAPPGERGGRAQPHRW
jgi:hypothetical protein